MRTDDRMLPRHELQLAVLLVLSTLMHAPVVRANEAGAIIEMCLLCLCMLSPVGVGFYLGACQIIPESSLLPLNMTGMGAALWCIMVLLRLKRFDMRILIPFALCVPYVVWVMLCEESLAKYTTKELLTSCVSAAMAVQCIIDSKYDFRPLLIGLAFGLGTICIAIVGSVLGAPFDVSTSGPQFLEHNRLGGGRHDATAVWPAVVLLTAILFPLIVSDDARLRVSNNVRIAGACLICVANIHLCICGVNGAIFALAFNVIIISLWTFVYSGISQGSLVRKAVGVGCVLALMFLIYLDAYGSRSRLAANIHEYAGERSMLASRSDVWRSSLSTIYKYPIYGSAATGGLVVFGSGYEEVGKYGAHNYVLGITRDHGLPALLLMITFVLLPYLRGIWLLRGAVRVWCICITSACAMIVCGISYPYKYMWAVWGLMIAVVFGVNLALRKNIS